MNTKQVKLLRYFVKASGDLALAGAIKARWSTMDHQEKGQLTTWLKKVIVTMHGLKDQAKKKQLARNLATLKGFV